MTASERYGRLICPHANPGEQHNCPRCQGSGFYLPELRIVTLHQPWASLMAWGEKRNETRPGTITWHRYRGWVAIHAGQREPTPADEWNDHIAAAMERHGDPEKLPLGQVLAVVRFVCSYPTARDHASVDEKERAFGDYSAGRIFITTGDPQPLAKPIEWKGGPVTGANEPEKLAHTLEAAQARIRELEDELAATVAVAMRHAEIYEQKLEELREKSVGARLPLQ